MCLFQVSVEVPVKVTAGGSVSGIAYWFTLGLSEGVALNTGPHGYEEVRVCMCLHVQLKTGLSLSLPPSCSLTGTSVCSCSQRKWQCLREKW